MDASDAASTSTKTMRLRYEGTCVRCGTAIPQGVRAVYDRAARVVSCLDCPAAPARAAGELPLADGVSLSDPEIPTAAADTDDVETGAAGASAKREYERRRTAREERIRTKHPRLGGLMLAVSEEPQSTRAWAVGAAGEEALGRRLNELDGVRALHDRRIPRSKANIDHIVVSAAGVHVIDAKKYKGRPELRVEGGILRPRKESLVVAGRDQTKLVTGVHKQTDLVRTALAAAGFDDVPVVGALCFVAADWPLIGGAFWIDKVLVAWPKKVADYVTADGDIPPERVAAVHRALAVAFPVA